jgi:histone deacetylase complex regulatory component SIN3
MLLVQDPVELLACIKLLFADHPDLLRSFSIFLPAVVQEQAREHLEVAARECEERQAVSEMV